VQVRGAIAEVGEKIDGTQIRRLHDLGLPSPAEVGFAEVVEAAEAVDHGAATGNFCVGRSVICEFLGKSPFKDMNGSPEADLSYHAAAATARQQRRGPQIDPLPYGWTGAIGGADEAILNPHHKHRCEPGPEFFRNFLELGFTKCFLLAL
jgi:hypothetical protein